MAYSALLASIFRPLVGGGVRELFLQGGRCTFWVVPHQENTLSTPHYLLIHHTPLHPHPSIHHPPLAARPLPSALPSRRQALASTCPQSIRPSTWSASPLASFSSSSSASLSRVSPVLLSTPYPSSVCFAHLPSSLPRLHSLAGLLFSTHASPFPPFPSSPLLLLLPPTSNRRPRQSFCHERSSFGSPKSPFPSTLCDQPDSFLSSRLFSCPSRPCLRNRIAALPRVPDGCLSPPNLDDDDDSARPCLYTLYDLFDCGSIFDSWLTISSSVALLI